MLFLNSSKVREQRLYCKNTERCLFLVHTVHVYSCQGVGGGSACHVCVVYLCVHLPSPHSLPSGPQTQEQGDKLPVCFLCPTHVHPPQKYLPCLMCSGSCALPAKAINCLACSCSSRVVFSQVQQSYTTESQLFDVGWSVSHDTWHNWAATWRDR